MIHRLSKRGRAQLCDSQIHRREREGGEDGKNLDLIDLSGSGEDASMAADRS